MIRRQIWNDRIERAWQSSPIVWLTGVRRVGKTTLAKGILEAEFLNCDLPSTLRLVEDPERFYRSLSKPVVVFDEIHQLPDPSLLLKIGADVFPHLKILATGSSTLAATQKFRDSLTGRKRAVHLLPVLNHELNEFGITDLRKRLLHGGLPEPLLAETKDPEFFAEWLDSYYARDVQELFRVGKRRAFLQLVETVLRNSGGLLQVTNLAKHVGLSRPTVQSYLDFLQITHVAFLLRPYHAGGRRELLRQPKAYGFDTGFVSYCRDWTRLRDQDCGALWEHFVLETLRSRLGSQKIYFWRDKDGREVDFVLPAGEGRVDAIECKWNAENLSVRGLRAFRAIYPHGTNYVVSPQVDRAYTRSLNSIDIVHCNLSQWDSVSDSL